MNSNERNINENPQHSIKFVGDFYFAKVYYNTLLSFAKQS